MVDIRLVASPMAVTLYVDGQEMTAADETFATRHNL